MEVWEGLAQWPAVRSLPFPVGGLQECMWDVQHCPEGLGAGQKQITGVWSQCCFVKPHSVLEGKNMNISIESHVNDCLFLKVLRWEVGGAAPVILGDRVKSQHGYISAANIIPVMWSQISFSQSSSLYSYKRQDFFL